MASLTLLNLSHPLTAAQVAAVEALAGARVERVVERMPQFDHGQPLAGQVRALVDDLGLSPREWQTLSLLVNLPGYAPAAGVVLAELHGRMGHFPAILRLRPVAGSVAGQFEVAEILNLQAVRDEARVRRTP